MLGWHSIISLFGRKNPCATLAKRFAQTGTQQARIRNSLGGNTASGGMAFNRKLSTFIASAHKVRSIEGAGDTSKTNRGDTSPPKKKEATRTEQKPNVQITILWSSWEWHDRIYLCADSGINCWSCLTQEQLCRAVFARRMLWRVISRCCFLSCLMLSTILCLCNFIVLFSRMADCKLMLFHLSTNAQAAARFWRCWWFITYLRNNT